MTANPILLQKKYARIVECYAETYHLTLEESLDRLYESELYQFMKNGISDLHCMSDEYLVEELHDEWMNKA